MTNNNGWPGKPGVPLNPERDGAHHWLSYEGEEPGLYEWDGKYWKMGGGHAPMDYVVDHFTYIAPVLTPAEGDARVMEARRDALEEAARRLEELHRQHKYNPKTGEGSEHDAGYYRALAEGAAYIRALKGEGND